MMSIPSPSHDPLTENPNDMNIDLHHDLFPDYYGGPGSAPSEPKHEIMGNDIDNGGNDGAPVVGENSSLPPVLPVIEEDNSLPPVPPDSSEGLRNDDPIVINDNNSHPTVLPGAVGEGLPYAPTHWPNADDIWGWKVGKRVNASGFYVDRYVSVPESLQKPGAPKLFGSKPALESFVRTSFPDADVDAFFASFDWKVPGILKPSTKAHTPSKPAGVEDDKEGNNKIAPRRTGRSRAPPPPPYSTPSSSDALNPSEPAEGTEDDKNGSNKITPRRTDRKRAPPPSPFITPTSSDGKKRQKTTKGSTDGTKMQKTTKGSTDGKKMQKTTKGSTDGKKMQKTTKGSGGPKRQTRHGIKDSAPPPPEPEEIDEVLDASFLDDETGRAEFDNYLNSLDDILAQPLPEEPVSHQSEMHNFFAAEGEMAEARRKLSSLLDMDFPSLICFKDLDELASLATKLRKDPTLSAEQLVKLMLIDEIPSFCQVFLENREVMEQADKFFTALEGNRTKVTTLKQEFSDLKQQVTDLQTEVDSNTLTVQDIDNQIAQLKARRAELAKLIDKRNKDKGELTYNQKLVANSIPKVVHEVQLANAKKPEWELKKDNAVRREAEILAKFAPLKGFSL